MYVPFFTTLRFWVLFCNFFLFCNVALCDSEGKIVAYPLLQSGPESMTIRTSLLRRGLFVLWGGWGKRKRERAENDEKGK